MASRFYTLTTGANYNPASNQIQYTTGAVVAGSNIVTVSLRDAVAIEAARVAAAARTGSTGLQIIGTNSAGAFVTVSSVNVGTGAVTLSANANLTIATQALQYWVAGIPNSQQNAISSVLCTNSTGTLTFVDANGASISFVNKLVAGAVYNFVIGAVTTATAGVFIGCAE